MSNPSPSTPIRILAIDGGGIGGIIPARILERLCSIHPMLLEKTNLIAGTSTGGLIALGLANGKSPAQMCDIYKAKCPEIFSARNRRNWVRRLFAAKYNPVGLRQAAKEIAGEKSLKELDEKKPLFIPLTAIKRPDRKHAPSGLFISTAYRVFHAPHLEEHGSGDWKCVDVALATSAAPTYFPAHAVQSVEEGFPGRWVCWDGGIVANNPSLSAVGEILRLHSKTNPSLEGRPDVRVLSLGTGYANLNIKGGDVGLIKSVQPVIQGLMDASVGSTDFLIKQFLGDRIARINPVAVGEGEYDMDDASAVERLDRFSIKQFDERGITVSLRSKTVRIPVKQWLDANW